jgi:hypothetical protein
MGFEWRAWAWSGVGAAVDRWDWSFDLVGREIDAGGSSCGGHAETRHRHTAGAAARACEFPRLRKIES